MVQPELHLRTRVAAGRQRSLTGWFSFERIQAAPHGSLVVRLMMAANDMQLANWSVVPWHGAQRPVHRHMQQGAIQYFIRLQSGHLREALKLVGKLRKEPQLLDRVTRCSIEARHAFFKLVDCLRGGPDHQKYEALIGRMRNQIAFHYDESQVKKALVRLADGNSPVRAKVTLGMDYFLDRFNLADTVTETIFVRGSWAFLRALTLSKSSTAAENSLTNCASAICASSESSRSIISASTLRSEARG